MKLETKSEKLGLGFLGRIMCTHEQACMRIIQPAHATRIMHTWGLAQKP